MARQTATRARQDLHQSVGIGVGNGVSIELRFLANESSDQKRIETLFVAVVFNGGAERKGER